MNTFLRLTAKVESRELVTEEFSIGSEDKKNQDAMIHQRGES